MAKLYNLARMYSNTTGTGALALSATVPGALSFSGAGVQDGDIVSYGIKDGTRSEVGRGVYSASGPTLTRAALKSTNDNEEINIFGPLAEVFITVLAEDFDDRFDISNFDPIAGSEIDYSADPMLVWREADEDPRQAMIGDVIAYAPVVARGPAQRTLRDRLSDRLNILDYATSSAGLTAARNGDASLKPLWDDAVADAQSLGARGLWLPGGHYAVATGETLLNPGLTLSGELGQTRITKAGTGNMFSCFGTTPTLAGHTLASNASAGDRSIALTTGHGASFTAGQVCILLSAANISAVDPSNVAEFVNIRSVAGDTINLWGPLTFGYSTSDTAQLVPASLIDGVAFSDIDIVMDDTVATASGSIYQAAHAIEARFCNAPVFRGVTISHGIRAGIALHGCRNARIYDYHCHDLGSADNDTDGSSTIGKGGYGYAIVEAGLNEGMVARGLHIARCRHGYTTTAQYNEIFGYGVPLGSIIAIGEHRDSKEAGWDTHQTGLDINFIGLQTIGSGRTGIQVRSPGAKVRDCAARDCFASGINVYGGGAAGGAGDNCVITNFKSENTNFGHGETYDGSTDWRESGAIRNSGLNTVFDGIVTKKSGGPFIYENSTARNATYRNVTAIDPCQSAVTNVYGVIHSQTAVDAPVLENIDIRSTDGKVADLVRTLSNNCVPRLFNVRGAGHTGKQFSSAGASDNIRFVSGGIGGQADNHGYRATVMIVSDAISITGRLENILQIAPETGTSDTLSSITGGEDGDVIMLRGTPGNTITITHSSSIDGLFMQDIGTITLAANQHVAFKRMSGVWFELYRANNNYAMVSRTQTLLNKTLTSPVINGGTINGAAVTGLSAPSAGGDAANKTYVDGIIAAQDAMVFKGVIDCSANPNYPAADRGATYRVSVAGKIGGGSGPNVEAGDLLVCLTDGTLAGAHGSVGANWSIAQTNLDGAVIGPASVTDGHAALFDGATGKLLKSAGFAPQPLDASLTAFAALTTAANKGIYFTGADAPATFDLTAAGRALLDDADAAAQRSTLGLVIGTDVQAYDAELAAIAGLTSAADRVPYFTGSGAAALATFTTAGRALVDDADASAQLSTLGVSTFIKTLVDDADGRAACATLGTWRILAASAVASAALTGTTSETAMATIAVPAGAMGPNGALRVTSIWSNNNSANLKAQRVRLGGLAGTQMSLATQTTALSSSEQRLIMNRNAQNAQVCFAAGQGGWSSSSGAVATATIDTSSAQNLVISGALANAGDSLTLEAYVVEILYGA